SLLCFFFFSSRRRHTIFSRDWSSDVCSSDLCLLLSFGRKIRPGIFSLIKRNQVPFTLGMADPCYFCKPDQLSLHQFITRTNDIRSEERRVGKEWRNRMATTP